MNSRCPTPGKTRYPSAYHAQAAMLHTLRYLKPATGFYPCRGHWHLTTKLRRRKRKR